MQQLAGKIDSLHSQVGELREMNAKLLEQLTRIEGFQRYVVEQNAVLSTFRRNLPLDELAGQTS